MTLPAGKNEAVDIWNGGEALTLRPEQMALGFNTGIFYVRQNKTFRIWQVDGKAVAKTK